MGLVARNSENVVCNCSKINKTVLNCWNTFTNDPMQIYNRAGKGIVSSLVEQRSEKGLFIHIWAWRISRKKWWNLENFETGHVIHHWIANSMLIQNFNRTMGQKWLWWLSNSANCVISSWPLVDKNAILEGNWADKDKNDAFSVSKRQLCCTDCHSSLENHRNSSLESFESNLESPRWLFLVLMGKKVNSGGKITWN